MSTFPNSPLTIAATTRTVHQPGDTTHCEGRTKQLRHWCTRIVLGCGPFSQCVWCGLGARIRWCRQGPVCADRTAHMISAAASTRQHCQAVSNTSWRACSRMPSAVSTSTLCTFNAGRNRTLSFAPAPPSTALASAFRACARHSGALQAAIPALLVSGGVGTASI